MELNLSRLRKRRHPLRKLFLILLALSLFLLLLLFLLVFQDNEDAIALGMFGAVVLFFLLHYLLWGRTLSAEVASGGAAQGASVLPWPDAGIPVGAVLLPSGETWTEDGIQGAEMGRNLGTAHIQRPQTPNS